jgi:uncharacterized protein (DUF1697 family)
MPALRGVLVATGFGAVRTYLQSGNLVLDSDLAPDAVRERIGGLLQAEFGLAVSLVTRTPQDLARVVAADPLRDHVNDPKRYQVSFLAHALDPGVAERLRGLVSESEQLVVADREVYTWHPDGVARSKLGNALAGNLGVTATARNWITVNALLELADAT